MRTTQAQNLGLSNRELGHRFAQCASSTFIGIGLGLLIFYVPEYLYKDVICRILGMYMCTCTSPLYTCMHARVESSRNTPPSIEGKPEVVENAIRKVPDNLQRRLFADRHIQVLITRKLLCDRFKRPHPC